VTQAQLLADLTHDVVVVAFFASVAFVATYTALARWWKSEIGRALVMLDSGLALALAPAVLHRAFGLALSESLGFAWYYFGSLTVVALAIIWRTVIVAKTQWRGRRNGNGHAR
jgi:hypothetical protein